MPSTLPTMPITTTDVRPSSENMPPVLQQQLKVANLEREVCNILGYHESQQMGLTHDLSPWIQNFDRQYQEMSQEFTIGSSPVTRVSLLKAKLGLYSFLATACFNYHIQSTAGIPSWAIFDLERKRKMCK